MKFFILSGYAHLVLDPASGKVSGGGELQMALLGAELVRRGHEVLIVGGDHGQPDDRILQGVRARTGGPFHTGGLLDTVRALPVVIGMLRREKPDYILILGWTTWLFFLWLAKVSLPSKLVFICGLDTEVNGEFRRENPVRGALFEWGVRHADIRFAMTDDQAALFKKAGLPCGLYRNLILPRSGPLESKKDIDFLWVARCQRIKRPHSFLDLAEALPEARCVMICPAEDRPLWESVQHRARTLANVTFYEKIPYHEIQKFYDRARIFVNTSTFEGFPNSFIQAGLGEAAILSLEVDSDSVITRFQAGLCAKGDAARFVEQARSLFWNPDQLPPMQAGAARMVRELFDNERNVAAFLSGLGP